MTESGLLPVALIGISLGLLGGGGAILFGLFAMAGAYLGAQLAVFFSGATQLILLAAAMLVAAFFMLRNNNKGSDEDEEDGASESPSGVGVPIWHAVGLAVGIAVGVFTGLVGVGGGFLIVPALVLLGQLQMKEAAGTLEAGANRSGSC